MSIAEPSPCYLV
ncbi:hypothetical protein JCM10207_001661 [Rhodosporidiobolus poonsookiae]